MLTNAPINSNQTANITKSICRIALSIYFVINKKKNTHMHTHRPLSNHVDCVWVCDFVHFHGTLFDFFFDHLIQLDRLLSTHSNFDKTTVCKSNNCKQRERLETEPKCMACAYSSKQIIIFDWQKWCSMFVFVLIVCAHSKNLNHCNCPRTYRHCTTEINKTKKKLRREEKKWRRKIIK